MCLYSNSASGNRRNKGYGPRTIVSVISSIIVKTVFMKKSEIRHTEEMIQIEVDAAYLYNRLADAEDNPTISDAYRRLAAIEQTHVDKAVVKANLEGIPVKSPAPSWRAKMLNRLGKMLGYEYVTGTLMDTEKSISNAIVTQKTIKGLPITGAESRHVQILESIRIADKKVPGDKLSQIEGKHRNIGGNALRAAVLGANDGLVSNMSLIMGVAGATAGGKEVMVAGIAGLLAGAISMSLGEWISVKSSQELYERQIAVEMDELENEPEEEIKELTLLYMAKGIPEQEASKLASEAMQDESHAKQILIREELGINPEDLKGSAMEAAITSFILFAIGAILPLIPFFFTSNNTAIISSLVVSTFGLFLIGTAITLFTGKSIWYSGTRQVIFGLIAAAVTFGIGKIIGVSIA